MALLQDTAIFLRLGHFQSKWPYLVRTDESWIFPWNHYWFLLEEAFSFQKDQSSDRSIFQDNAVLIQNGPIFFLNKPMHVGINNDSTENLKINPLWHDKAILKWDMTWQQEIHVQEEIVQANSLYYFVVRMVSTLYLLIFWIKLCQPSLTIITYPVNRRLNFIKTADWINFY